MARTTVAVVGLGVMGLVALKNMLEEDFDATGFEKNNYVGGLWRFNEGENITSITETTKWNTISFTSCYTDYPFPPGTSDYPTDDELQSYLAAYCDHFSLRPHLRLRHKITNISRTKNDQKWVVSFVDADGRSRRQEFDKVIIATGEVGRPTFPRNITGLENFKGKVMHGQAFKRASDFKDNRVLVVGASNSAADCATDLCGHAAKVYLSHRNGNLIIPRYVNGVPAEFDNTLRLQLLGGILGTMFPSQWSTIFNKVVLQMSEKAFGRLPKEWRFNVLPPPGQMCNPIINDKVVDRFWSGEITVVHNLAAVQPTGEPKLVDGTVLSDVDTIIFCTGYEYDLSILSDDVNPVLNPHPEWDRLPSTAGKPLVDLYQGIYSLDYPQSLAIIGLVGYPASQMPMSDLISMGIAQAWKGDYKLPTREDMRKEIDERHAWLLETARSSKGVSAHAHSVKAGPWIHFLHDAAGTGVNEKLGYGWRGWLYWLSDFSLCNALMGGVLTPHAWRLFNGRRKKWDGARDAIIQVSEEVNRMKKVSKKPVKNA